MQKIEKNSRTFFMNDNDNIDKEYSRVLRKKKDSKNRFLVTKKYYHYLNYESKSWQILSGKLNFGSFAFCSLLLFNRLFVLRSIIFFSLNADAYSTC